MKPYDAKSCFSRLLKNQYFIRVDSSHPLDLYLGVDREGNKALRFAGTFTRLKVSGTKAIKVKQFSVESREFIQFSLIDSDVADPFYKFIDDLVDSSRRLESSQDGYRFVLARFNRWKRMFLPARGLLSENEILGLLGELYFLYSYMIPKYGEEVAIRSWSASDPTIKDFSVGDTWYEIKTTGVSSKTIHIHSLQQLEFDRPGKLVLIRLEKMAGSFSGLNLNSLVQTLMNIIASPETLEAFQTKIAQRGYVLNEKYDEYVYEARQMTGYLVDDKFPKMDSNKMDAAIVNAEYDLLINELKNYIAELN